MADTTSMYKKFFRLGVGQVCSILFVVFVILSIPIYIFRFIVITAAKFRTDFGEILNPISSFLATDLFSGKPPRSNIVVTKIIKGHVSLHELRNNMVLKNWICAKDETGNLLYEKFQMYPYKWLGFTFWKRGNFDINNHVFFHENLGNHTVSDNEVDLFTEKLLNAPYKAETSTWEVHLIHNHHNPKLCSESTSVIILKIHHSLGDGYSVVTAIVEGLFQHPLMNMPVPRFPKKTFKKQLVYLLTVPFTGFYELAYALGYIVQTCPWKVSDHNKSWHQLCGKSELIPIQKIKDIKNALGVSFTSVLLSAISAGIHLHLENKKTKSLYQNEGYMYCLSALPLPGHTRRLTNHLAIASFDIPTKEFHDPMERVKACDRILETAKTSVIPHVNIFYVNAAGSHLNSVCSFLAKNRMVSTGLTNFPSLPIRVDRGKHKGLAVHFTVGALPGIAGVAFMVLSYNEHIRFVMTAEESIMSRSDLNIFIKRFTDEINTLNRLKVKTNEHM